MCVEPLVLPHEPGGDPSQPVDIPEAVSAEDKLAKRILSGLAFAAITCTSWRGRVRQGAHRLPARQAAHRRAFPARTRHALRPQAGILSEILSKLEMGGIIERSRNPKDRRQLTIRLTEAGWEKARVEQAARIRFREQAFSALTHDEREQLAEMLEKIRVTWEELDD